MQSVKRVTVLGIEAPQRIPSLDGLRAVSIVAVLWSHLAETYGLVAIPSVRALGDFGVLGVRVFFVISGFLITTLLLTEETRNGSISLKWFYFRRTLRIFPALYFFIAVIAAGAAFSLVSIPSAQFVYGLTYTMNYVANPSHHLGHLWSLAVEEQFYLLWPLTLVLLGTQRALKVAGAVILISPIMRFGSLYIPAARPLIGWSFPTIADPLAMGCLLAGASLYLGKHRQYMEFLRSRWFWVVPALIPVLNAFPGTKVNLLVAQSLLNAFIAISIDRFVRIQDGAVWRFLNWLPLRCIGVLSYSLYLWQQPFLTYAGPGMWSVFPLNLLGAFVCAYCSYRLVEKPCLNLRVYLERRWKKRAKVATNVPDGILARPTV